jgi:GNAT superfamily N-acetyltransferase
MDVGMDAGMDDLVLVDDELRLRAYAGDADLEVAGSWCSGTRDEVAARYRGLAARGDVYLVERRTASGWAVVSDVTLAVDGLPIVIAPDHRRQGLARRVLLRLVDRARVLGWSELRVQDPVSDEAARGLFTGIGFRPCVSLPPALALPLSPVGGRSRC